MWIFQVESICKDGIFHLTLIVPCVKWQCLQVHNWVLIVPAWQADTRIFGRKITNMVESKRKMFKIMTFYFHIVLLLNRYVKRWESSQVQYPTITPHFTFCGSYILNCVPFGVVWWNLVPSYSAHDMNHPSVQSTQAVYTIQPVSHSVAVLDIRWTVMVPQCSCSSSSHFTY